MESLIRVEYIGQDRRAVGQYLSVVNLDEFVSSSKNAHTHLQILTSTCIALKNSTHGNNWYFRSSRIAIVNELYDRLNMVDQMSKSDFYNYLSKFLPSDANHIMSVKFYNLINGIELIK